MFEEPDIALFNLAAPLESRQCVAGETLVVLEAPGVEVGGGGFICAPAPNVLATSKR